MHLDRDVVVRVGESLESIGIAGGNPGFESGM